jgi:hypothetical protein
MVQQIHERAVDVIGAAVTAKMTQGGAAAGVLGWLIHVNWIGVMGVLIGLAGLAANFYFQHKRDKREHAEAQARLEMMAKKNKLRRSDSKVDLP